MKKDLVKTTDSHEMDEMYAAGLLHPTRQTLREAPKPTEEEIQRVGKMVEAQTNDNTTDVMLLQRWNGKLIAEAFKLPEMEIEIERAVEQVEKAIKEKHELEQEKDELVQSAKQRAEKEVDEAKR